MCLGSPPFRRIPFTQLRKSTGKFSIAELSAALFSLPPSLNDLAVPLAVVEPPGEESQEESVKRVAQKNDEKK